MPLEAEWAAYATKTYRNFGCISTSRVEGLHAQMKRYLINRLACLKQLGDAIRSRTEAMKREYDFKLVREMSRVTSTYKNTGMLRHIVLDVGFKALRMIYIQYQAAK